MKNIKRFNWLVASLLVSMLAVSVSFAQDTASAIRGTVTDSSGNAISGATVTVKHESTGATKTLTTNASGNYQARGLRVGGPYTVSISSDGYNSGKQEDVYIVLGETKDVNVTLAADDQKC
ncbi:MAG: carboxypeptidase-like regulatory domain-containing protein [Gammaproteobacteria bacterium]